ncbi:MAG: NAD(P)H-hydrate dehydratase [Pelomonas sp.]|nr:NAD(P)H-hydrate dehydratase [Roseateles sp.]
MFKVLPAAAALPLHGSAGSRRVERRVLARRPDLIEDAGLAVAKLALALHRGGGVWVACGPGNNGADGRVAARHLAAQGLAVSTDDAPPPDTGLVVDALFGLGLARPLEDAWAARVAQINALAGRATVLAVDLPSGLDAERGVAHGSAVRADHTLALLTLKPGLLTGAGRACAGTLWFDALGEAPADALDGAPTATLIGRDRLAPWRTRDPLAHKGTQGDVQVVAGSMPGAARLAARAALAAGAGRVYAEVDDALRPELLRWDGRALATVVAGCGGGARIVWRLPALLDAAPRLVLDADALNAIARDPALAAALRARAAPTLLTPHPPEAARLLETDAAAVQADRLGAARALAARYACTVVLKGSGSVVAAPGRVPAVNGSGGPALATPGSGDVLAGWAGGLWAQRPGLDAFDVACAAVHWHGLAGDTQAHGPLRANELIERMLGLDPR